MRVKCLAQEHNTVSPTRARSGDERTNHETTTSPSICSEYSCFIYVVKKKKRRRQTDLLEKGVENSQCNTGGGGKKYFPKYLMF